MNNIRNIIFKEKNFTKAFEEIDKMSGNEILQYVFDQYSISSYFTKFNRRTSTPKEIEEIDVFLSKALKKLDDIGMFYANDLFIDCVVSFEFIHCLNFYLNNKKEVDVTEPPQSLTESKAPSYIYSKHNNSKANRIPLLFFAVSKGRINLIKNILQNMNDLDKQTILNKKDKYGKNVCFYARNLDMLSLLADNGASLNEIGFDKKDLSLFFIEKLKNNTEKEKIIKYLTTLSLNFAKNENERACLDNNSLDNNILGNNILDNKDRAKFVYYLLNSNSFANSPKSILDLDNVKNFKEEIDEYLKNNKFEDKIFKQKITRAPKEYKLEMLNYIAYYFIENMNLGIGRFGDNFFLKKLFEKFKINDKIVLDFNFNLEQDKNHTLLYLYFLNLGDTNKNKSQAEFYNYFNKYIENFDKAINALNDKEKMIYFVNVFLEVDKINKSKHIERLLQFSFNSLMNKYINFENKNRFQDIFDCEKFTNKKSFEDFWKNFINMSFLDFSFMLNNVKYSQFSIPFLDMICKDSSKKNSEIFNCFFTKIVRKYCFVPAFRYTKEFNFYFTKIKQTNPVWVVPENQTNLIKKLQKIKENISSEILVMAQKGRLSTKIATINDESIKQKRKNFI